MADYIRREDAIKYAEHAYHEWNLAMAAADGKREINLVYKRQELCKAVESVFRDMPAADVAPVVRCKDCNHYDMSVCLKIYSDGSVHPAAWQSRKPEDFCSYGERKDNDEH